MTNGSIVFLGLTLAIFNIPILVVAACLPFVESLGRILREKEASPAHGEASYSRVTGLFGAVIITAFFWAIGNVVIWKSFTSVADVAPILDSSGKFFLVGSALFLPYAFNQLRATFRGPATAVEASTTAIETSSGTRKLAPGVVPPQGS